MKTYQLSDAQAELVTACLYARAVWLEDQIEAKRWSAHTPRAELKRLRLALRVTRKTVIVFETNKPLTTNNPLTVTK
jgi:hypothetical protein